MNQNSHSYSRIGCHGADHLLRPEEGDGGDSLRMYLDHLFAGNEARAACCCRSELPLLLLLLLSPPLTESPRKTARRARRSTCPRCARRTTAAWCSTVC